MKVAGWVGVAVTVLVLLPLAMGLAVATVLVPAAVAPIRCADTAAAGTTRWPARWGSTTPTWR